MGGLSYGRVNTLDHPRTILFSGKCYKFTNRCPLRIKSFCSGWLDMKGPLLSDSLAQPRPSEPTGQPSESVPGSTKSSSARAKRAFATSPLVWAWRPSSSLKVSKIPKVSGPDLKANHAIVPTSASTSGVAELKKCWTSASLPGRAFNVARIPSVLTDEISFESIELG